MVHKATLEPWKSLLPPVDAWLQGVSINATASLPSAVVGAHVVVLVKPDSADKERLSVESQGLSDAWKKRVLEVAENLGYRPSGGPIHLLVDQTTVTLIPVSSVAAHQKQVSRQAGLDLAKSNKDLRISQLYITGTNQSNVLDVAEGYFTGLYAQHGFKGQKKSDHKWPTKLTLIGSEVDDKQIFELREFSRAQVLARFLQDAPPNYLTPSQFAEVATDLAKEFKLKSKVLGSDEMKSLGMGMFLSVAAGSAEEPKCVTLEIPGHDVSRTIALVGKGLTFDAGGISLKGSAGMEEMKYDMSGGAAVLAAARYFAVVKPPVNVVIVIGATENMPSGSAVKPSDVVRAFNGKTVEILNTDAEGRLVLGDCLSYVIQEYKPVLVADIATLTGAVLMALGSVGGAVFGSDKTTAETALRAAERAGEPFWQLPLWPELEKEVKGDTADLKNIAKPSVKAGSIMGALFLKEFVGQTPWIHLDVAGTAWNCQALGYPASGSGAFGLRTLVQLCLQFA